MATWQVFESLLRRESVRERRRREAIAFAVGAGLAALLCGWSW